MALWVSGEQEFNTAIGPLKHYDGGGLLLSSDGELLPVQHRNLAGLISLGGWLAALARVALQLQFDGHSVLFKRSQQRELNQFAGQLAMGGSIDFGRT